MRRSVDVDELLDGPLPDAEAVRGNLRDLARINRRAGGVRASERAIERLTDGRDAVTILDVGTGGADLPVAWLRSPARARQPWSVTAIDSRPEILAAAAVRDPRVGATPGLDLHVADGRHLPYPDDAFDVVHCSLVVHHLEPPEVVELAREMARVSRLGVVINDLIRGRLAWAGAWTWAHVTTRNRFTRYDAPLSVRRAYTRAELRHLLDEAGLRVVGQFDVPFGFRWAVAAVPAGSPVSEEVDA
jgi:SAM-dependent methyltransferase